ncbi:MAG TPA: hypothetical protein DIC51_05125 [Coxiellaceae bacterium]|nr:hypothetical protein [Coxiellaceae bacterium]
MMPVPRPQTLSEAFIAYKQQKSTAPKELLGESEIIQALQDLSPENRKNLFKVLLCFLTCESFWAPNPTDTLIRQIYDAAIAALPGTPEERNRIINECRAHFPSALAEPLSERAFNVIVHRAVPITSAWRPSFTSPLTHGTPTYVPQASEEDEETFLSHFQQYMSASDHQSPSLLPEPKSYLVQVLDPEQPLSLFARFPSEIARTIFFMIPLDERDPVENPIVQLRFVCHFFDAMLKRLIPLGQEDELSLALMQKICREIPETSVIGNVRDIAPTIQMGAMPLPEPHASYAGSRVIKQIWRYHNVSRNWLERRVGDPTNPQAFLQKTIQMLYPISETATPEMRAEIEAFHAALLAEYHRRSYETTHRDARCLFFPPQSALAAGDNMDAVVDRLCGMLLRSDCQIEAIYILEQLTDENEHALAQAIALSEKKITVKGIPDFDRVYLAQAYLFQLYERLKRFDPMMDDPLNTIDWLAKSPVTIETRSGRPIITGLTILHLYPARFLRAALDSDYCSISNITLSLRSKDRLILQKALGPLIKVIIEKRKEDIFKDSPILVNACCLMKLCDQLGEAFESLPIDWHVPFPITTETNPDGTQVITGLAIDAIDDNSSRLLCTLLGSEHATLSCLKSLHLSSVRQPSALERLVRMIITKNKEGIIKDSPILVSTCCLIKLCDRLGKTFESLSINWRAPSPITTETNPDGTQIITRLTIDTFDESSVQFLCAVLRSELCAISEIIFSSPTRSLYGASCSSDPSTYIKDETSLRTLVKAIIDSGKMIAVKGAPCFDAVHALMRLHAQLITIIPNLPDPFDFTSGVTITISEGRSVITGLTLDELSDHSLQFLHAILSSEHCAISHLKFSFFRGRMSSSYEGCDNATEKLARMIVKTRSKISVTGLDHFDAIYSLTQLHEQLQSIDPTVPSPVAYIAWYSLTTKEGPEGTKIITGFRVTTIDDDFFRFFCAALNSEHCDITQLSVSSFYHYPMLGKLVKAIISSGRKISIHGIPHFDAIYSLIQLHEQLKGADPAIPDLFESQLIDFDSPSPITTEEIPDGTKIVTGLTLKKLNDDACRFLRAVLNLERSAIATIAFSQNCWITGSALGKFVSTLICLRREIAVTGIPHFDIACSLAQWLEQLKSIDPTIPDPFESQSIDWQAASPITIETDSDGVGVVTGLTIRELNRNSATFLCEILLNAHYAISTLTFSSSMYIDPIEMYMDPKNETSPLKKIARTIIESGRQITIVGHPKLEMACSLLRLYDQLKRINPAMPDFFGCIDWLQDEPLPITTETRADGTKVIIGVTICYFDKNSVQFLCAALESEYCAISNLTFSPSRYYLALCDPELLERLARAIIDSRRKIIVIGPPKLDMACSLLQLYDQLKRTNPTIPNPFSGRYFMNWYSDEPLPITTETRPDGIKVITGLAISWLSENSVQFICAALESEHCAISTIVFPHDLYRNDDALIQLAKTLIQCRRVVKVIGIDFDPFIAKGYFIQLYEQLQQTHANVPAHFNMMGCEATMSVRWYNGTKVITELMFHELNNDSLQFLCAALSSEQCAITHVTFSSIRYNEKNCIGKLAKILANCEKSIPCDRVVTVSGIPHFDITRSLAYLYKQLIDTNPGKLIPDPFDVLECHEYDRWGCEHGDSDIYSAVTIGVVNGSRRITGLRIRQLNDRSVQFLSAVLNSREWSVTTLSFSNSDRWFNDSSFSPGPDLQALGALVRIIIDCKRKITITDFSYFDEACALAQLHQQLTAIDPTVPDPFSLMDWVHSSPLRTETRPDGTKMITELTISQLDGNSVRFLCAALKSEHNAIQCFRVVRIICDDDALSILARTLLDCGGKVIVHISCFDINQACALAQLHQQLKALDPNIPDPFKAINWTVYSPIKIDPKSKKITELAIKTLDDNFISFLSAALNSDHCAISRLTFFRGDRISHVMGIKLAKIILSSKRKPKIEGLPNFDSLRKQAKAEKTGFSTKQEDTALSASYRAQGFLPILPRPNDDLTAARVGLQRGVI